MTKCKPEDPAVKYIRLLPTLYLVFREGRYQGWYNPRKGDQK